MAAVGQREMASGNYEYQAWLYSYAPLGTYLPIALFTRQGPGPSMGMTCSQLRLVPRHCQFPPP